MSNDNKDLIVPPLSDDRSRPQTNRTVLGILLALLGIAVLLAVWALIFNNGDSGAFGSNAQPTPTALTVPTPAPTVAPTATPIPAPSVAPTTLPTGFEACGTAQSPSTTGTYVVDTNTTPLNQRAEPSVSGELAGTFRPGRDDLTFTGECVVNVDDGYTWWKINNGTADVWIASTFVSPN